MKLRFFFGSKDVLALLFLFGTTGFGKSLLFQLIFGLCAELDNLGYNEPRKFVITFLFPAKAMYLKLNQICHGTRECTRKSSRASPCDHSGRCSPVTFVTTYYDFLIDDGSSF